MDKPHPDEQTHRHAAGHTNDTAFSGASSHPHPRSDVPPASTEHRLLSGTPSSGEHVSGSPVHVRVTNDSTAFSGTSTHSHPASGDSPQFRALGAQAHTTHTSFSGASSRSQPTSDMTPPMPRAPTPTPTGAPVVGTPPLSLCSSSPTAGTHPPAAVSRDTPHAQTAFSGAASHPHPSSDVTMESQRPRQDSTGSATSYTAISSQSHVTAVYASAAEAAATAGDDVLSGARHRQTTYSATSSHPHVAGANTTDPNLAASAAAVNATAASLNLTNASISVAGPAPVSPTEAEEGVITVEPAEVAAVVVSKRKPPAVTMSVKDRKPALVYGQAGSVRVTDICQRPPVDMYYYVPKRLKEVRAPNILFVIHGKGGRGKSHRDTWIPLAEEGGFAVLAPTFAEELFAHRDFQQCGVLGSDGRLQSPEMRTFNVLEALFDMVLRNNGWKTEHYSVHGHSAGAQFASRLALLMPATTRVHKIVAANAGSYTFLDPRIDYPFGLAVPLRATRPLDPPAPVSYPAGAAAQGAVSEAVRAAAAAEAAQSAAAAEAARAEAAVESARVAAVAEAACVAAVAEAAAAAASAEIAAAQAAAEAARATAAAEAARVAAVAASEPDAAAIAAAQTVAAATADAAAQTAAEAALAAAASKEAAREATRARIAADAKPRVQVVDDRQLRVALGRRLTVLLGTADTDPQCENLPSRPGQGPHRLARGAAFYASAAARVRHGDSFHWRIVTVDAVGHQAHSMSRYAGTHLDLLF